MGWSTAFITMFKRIILRRLRGKTRCHRCNCKKQHLLVHGQDMRTYRIFACIDCIQFNDAVQTYSAGQA